MCFIYRERAHSLNLQHIAFGFISSEKKLATTTDIEKKHRGKIYATLSQLQNSLKPSLSLHLFWWIIAFLRLFYFYIYMHLNRYKMLSFYV